MTKRRPSPSKAKGSEQQFEKLLAAMGIGETADPFGRYALTRKLEQLERAYARGVAVSAKQPDRELVRSYRATITKLLTLSETIGPDFFGYEIEKAGLSRYNPDADDSTLGDLMDGHGHRRTDVDADLKERGLNIDHWLRTSGEVYRMRDMRKLLVVPFLQLMAEHEITTSRKQLPRKRMFDALFDWLGVEKKFRPSSAGINAIARDLVASSSESNAKRQTKN